jgi:hypothetical protein
MDGTRDHDVKHNKPYQERWLLHVLLSCEPVFKNEKQECNTDSVWESVWAGVEKVNGEGRGIEYGWRTLFLWRKIELWKLHNVFKGKMRNE